MDQLLAFHNDLKVKKKYVKRVLAHYKADEIAHGFYWENGKGCGVGCTIENDGTSGGFHQRYEEKLGVPRILARLEDRIFEGMENGDSKEFPLRFLEAINVGADLSLVFYKFFHWVLVDPTDGVIKFARPDGKKAIQDIADLFMRKINGEDINFSTWMTARRAAYGAAAAAYAAAAAAAYAAYAADAAAAAAYAADAAAAYAADAYAADAYAAAAAYAADAAAAAAYAADAARKNARSAHYKKMADKLIEILKATK